MNSLEQIKSLYKPYRYTIKGKCLIIETTSGNFVIKKSTNEKELPRIFNYLSRRGFTNFPEIFSENRNGDYIAKYIENSSEINPNIDEDLINVVSMLHVKTSYRKEVSEDTYKEVYENILNNILYLKEYYQTKYDLFLKSIYSSPSEYLFLKNYSKLMASLNFSEEELNNWYSLVKDTHSERVSLIHNNLSKEHFISSDKDYLISWDNATFDTPILDLVKIYQSDLWKSDFNYLYKRYLLINNLTDSEQKLFFLIIGMAPLINFTGTEFECTKNMRSKLDYLYKTEIFLKPYYTTNTDN